jgi:hypothetical protein
LAGLAMDDAWSFLVGLLLAEETWFFFAGRVRNSSKLWASVKTFLYVGEFFTIVASNILLYDVGILEMFYCKYI